MFGKRNVQQAFTSRYLSSEVGWTRGRGWWSGGCSQAMSWQVEKRQTWTCLCAYPPRLLWHRCWVWCSTDDHLKPSPAESVSKTSHVLNRSESSLSKQYNTAGFRAIEKDLTMELAIKQKHTWLFVSLVHHECVTQGDFMCYFGNKNSCVGMKCFKFTRRYPASIVPLSKTGLTVKHHHSSTDLFVTERKPASIVAFITSSTRKKKKILRDQNPRPFFASLQEQG